jgi:hypothetical protein
MALEMGMKYENLNFLNYMEIQIRIWIHFLSGFMNSTFVRLTIIFIF